MNFRKKPSAVAFVDYEHWLIAMKNLYKTTPDVKGWAQSVRDQYRVKDILFFANFNHPALKNEIPRLREVTNSVIETQLREDNHPMKDMSDVVMIDALYRAGHEKHGPKIVILFTGDGHFQPVARYLAQDCGKKVVLYGVQNATSRMLKDVVTEYHEVPDAEAQTRMCYELVTEEMARLTRRYGEVIASFGSMSQRISENNNVPRKTVEMALHEMRDRGLISTQRRKHTDKRGSFDNIVPEWDKLIEAGLYPAEESA